MRDRVPYRFSLVQMRAVGFVVQAAESETVWPGFADVFLHVHPQPGEGLSFYYFPDPMTAPQDRLPGWALDAIEQGVLHACFVGGPGEIPLTDLRIEVRRGRFDPLHSGERAFFVAAYMAMRKAIHLGCKEGPRVLEYMSQLTLHTLTLHETVLINKLNALGATGLRVVPEASVAHESRIEAVVPARNVETMRELCQRLNRVGRSGRVEVQGLGYRGHSAPATEQLVRRLGPPADWPRGDDEVPTLGGRFPALPQATEATLWS